MSNQQVQNNGRIFYIDPNFIDGNSSYRDIPHPYEDYCIGVDLKVQMPRRDSFGPYNLKETVWEGTTTVFMNGTSGSLTTNYTEITMVNPQNNTTECLGIESINVSFDAWQHPLVTIKFVDVRAATLFGPQEQGYYNTMHLEKDTGKRTASIYGGSFYKALFSMPSPLFKLTLKGFYGKPITLDLAISSYKSNFNGGTGCFELTVTFVGYMYGVYIDLPLSYCVLAPYLSIGDNKDWSTNPSFVYKSEGNFDSSRILTYSELRKRLAIVNAEFDKIPQSETKQNQVRLINKKSALEHLNNTYHILLDKAFTSDGYCENIDAKSGKYYLMAYAIVENKWSNHPIVFVESQSYSINREAMKDCTNEYSTLLREIEQYNKDYNNELPFRAQNYWTENSNDTLPKSSITGDVGEYVVNYLRTKSIPSLLGERFDYFSGSMSQSLVKSTSANSALILYPLADPFGIGLKINKMISDIKSELDSVTQDVVQEREYATEALVGFDYTIGNVYRMLFAHMEVFVTAFYDMLLDAWQNGSSRTLKELGISVEETDLPGNWDVNNPIPPFTYFYEIYDENGGATDSNTTKENGRTRPPKKRLAYPNFSISETIFINRMIMAAVAFGQEEKRINELIAKLNQSGETDDNGYSNEAVQNYGNTITSPSEYIAITPHDFVTNSDAPYEYLNSSHIQRNYFYQYVFVTFAIRMFYFYAKSAGYNELSSTQIDTKLFSKIEANNFRKSHPKLTPEVKELLEKGEGEYLSFITTRNANGFIDKDFAGPILTKKGDSYEYTMYESPDGDTIEYFPIAITDPTNIGLDVYNKNKFARIDEAWTDDDDYWEFVSANDVLLRYGEKAEDAQYNALIGNSNLRDLSSYNYKQPSLVCDVKTGKSYFIYGHRFLYDQNKNDDSTRLFAKSYMFVMGLDCKISLSQFKSEGFHPYMIPFEMILLVGAARYRMDYMDEHEGKDLIICDDKIYKKAEKNELYMYNPAGSNNTAPGFVFFEKAGKNSGDYFRFDDYVGWLYKLNSKFAEAAKNFFIEWTNNSFKKINGELEILKDCGNLTFCPYDGNGFVKYIESASETVSGIFVIKKKINIPNKVYAEESYKVDTDNNAIGNLKISFDGNTELEKLVKEPFGYYGAISLGFRDSVYDAIGEGDIKTFYKDFIGYLKDLYEGQTVSESEYQSLTDVSYYANKDLKLSIYCTLRNLYDRWFANGKPEKWKLDVDGSDFNSFKFIDSMFEDASNLKTNIENVNNLISSYAAISANLEKSPDRNFLGGESKSVYEYLAHVAQDTGGILMAIPVNTPTGNEDSRHLFAKNIETTFTPYTYNNSPLSISTTYLFLYPQKPSEHLAYDNLKDDDYQYVNDGFDLANTMGELVELPLVFADKSDASFDVPVFGVSYGRQNQSIFRDISVNMDVPQVTEASISATMNIASRATIGPREQVLYGQDLYKVFSNYSYTCNVEMLGDMQIMPLMYFQLNNIPLFKGVYQIVKVEHNFTPGNATTSFVGVRVNANQMAKADNTLSNIDSTWYRDNAYFIDNLPESDVLSLALRKTWANYGLMSSEASRAKIKEMYNEIKEGLCDTLPKERQMVTVDGQDKSLALVESKDVNWRRYRTNLELVKDTIQPILDAWLCYANRHGISNPKVRITDGYRDVGINGNNNSAHLHGLAVDWQPYEVGLTRELFAKFIVAYCGAKNVAFDQIIDEVYGVKEDIKNGSHWVHFGVKSQGGAQRKQVFNGLAKHNGRGVGTYHPTPNDWLSSTPQQFENIFK